MKNLPVLIIGVIIGAGGMYLYHSQAVVPALTQRVTTEVKQMVETERMAQEKFVVGIFTQEVDENTIIITQGELPSGSQELSDTSYTVTLDANTRISKIDTSAAGGVVAITRDELLIGSTLTVVTSAEVGNQTTIHAQEIIQR